eukprot:sb/3462488/
MSSCYGNQDSCYGNQDRDPSWLISASIVPSCSDHSSRALRELGQANALKGLSWITLILISIRFTITASVVPSTLNLQELDDATFTCQGSGSLPISSYVWYKNSTVIPGETSATLELSSLQGMHSSTYHCLATWSSVGNYTSSTTVLTVQDVETTPVLFRGVFDATVTITCVGYGDTINEIDWMTDDTTLDSSYQTDSTYSDYSMTSVLQYTSYENEPVFVCKVKYSDGDTRIGDNVTVTYMPDIEEYLLDLSSETAKLSSTNSSYGASNAFDRNSSTTASSNCVDNSAPTLKVDFPQLTCVKYVVIEQASLTNSGVNEMDDTEVFILSPNSTCGTIETSTSDLSAEGQTYTIACGVCGTGLMLKASPRLGEDSCIHVNEVKVYSVGGTIRGKENQRYAPNRIINEYKNSTVIPGETSATLELSSLQGMHSSTYHCLATWSSVGNYTSSTTVLTVQDVETTPVLFRGVFDATVTITCVGYGDTINEIDWMTDDTTLDSSYQTDSTYSDYSMTSVLQYTSYENEPVFVCKVKYSDGDTRIGDNVTVTYMPDIEEYWLDLSSETATLSSTNSSYGASNAFDRNSSTTASSNCVDNSAPTLKVDFPQLTCVKYVVIEQASLTNSGVNEMDDTEVFILSPNSTCGTIETSTSDLSAEGQTYTIACGVCGTGLMLKASPRLGEDSCIHVNEVKVYSVDFLDKESAMCKLFRHIVLLEFRPGIATLYSRTPI